MRAALLSGRVGLPLLAAKAVVESYGPRSENAWQQVLRAGRWELRDEAEGVVLTPAPPETDPPAPAE